MKKFIEKLNDYRYRKRLKKWVVINIKQAVRKTKRFFKSEKFKQFVKSVPFITGCISVLAVAVISAAALLFSKYACPFFDGDRRIISRLTMTEFDDSVPYLKALYALGSSNRIQVTLKTDTENYINPRGVDLDRGSVNLMLTFSDGNTAEFALNNSNYDNFESGMTDTFTLILPFGYTPFDITDYTLTVLPDINNVYDNWHCRWARVYFLLGNEPVMLARESWEDVAVFGSGEDTVKQSALEIVHTDNNKYNRTKQIYSYYLSLAQKGASELVSGSLKADALDSLGLNGGKFLYLDIETVNIEMQNNILTYYTKGAEIPEIDSLDYDGRLFLDVTFFSAKSDGGYTESYLLDTLGTDDFELGTTSSFKLELPEGMCVFDISSMSVRAENPYDSWAPHYIRVYIKPDYCDMLEIARLNDTMLVNSFSTPVFYKNLIDTGVELDLSAKFCISEVIKDKIESENLFKFGQKIADMYFKLQSFYDRQNVFYEQAVSLYIQSVYEAAPETENLTEDEDEDIALPDIEETEQTDEPQDETEQTDVSQDETEQTDVSQDETEQIDTPQDETEQVDVPQDETEQTDTPQDSGTETSGSSEVWIPDADEPQKEPTHDIWNTQEDSEQ